MGFWEWPAFCDDLGRLGAAMVLGGAIGLERELHGHWAGFRTHIMVALGAAIFVIGGTAAHGQNIDGPSRVIQGVASGIGFLGAGTILKLSDKMQIKGLTTASSIWLAAALGIASGLAEYSLATAAAVISLFVLGVLGPVEKALERRHKLRRKHDPNSSDDDVFKVPL
jgi:putative Mg2+ transporter-C (MgtC) family protein